MGKLKKLNLPSGDLEVYEAQPAGDCKGGLIVIHEVWGLADHIKNVADRFAGEGYLVIAPDLLSGTIDVAVLSGMQQDLFNPKKRNEVQPKLRAMMAPIQNPEFGTKTLAAVKDCFSYLYKRPETKEHVSIIGYCFGGSYSFSLAVNEPRLKMSLPFYGHADFSVEELKQVKCPVHGFYGEKDEGLMASLPQLKVNMGQAGVDFTAQVYPDCGHAFFNDTNPYAYNQKAADDAWSKVLAYLKA